MSPRTYSASPSPDAPLATWAVWYAAQGIPVFPCKGKVPATPKGFYDATCDPFRVEMWWRNMPSANIATPTGKDYWVVDCDPRNGGESTWAALVQRYSAPLPTALCLTGGGGTHQYYQLPDEGSVRHHSAALGTGLDVQAVGGYVILPPSIHPDTGKAYAWDLGSDLESPGICEAPGWLLALVTQAGEENAQGGAGRPTTDPGEPIPLGVREATLVRIGSAMRHAGGCYAEILAALAEAAARCDPPMLEKDYTRIAKSVTRYDVDPVFEAGGEKPETPSWGSAGEKKRSLDLTQQITASEIMKCMIVPPRFLIEGLIPDGLTILSATTKGYKSFFALSLALATIGAGDWCDAFPVDEKGPVVFFALESPVNQLHNRLLQLLPHFQPETLPHALHFFSGMHALPSLRDGLQACLEQAIEAYHPRLIIIDPLTYLYRMGRQQDLAGATLDLLWPLAEMAANAGISLLVAEHLRKPNKDDTSVVDQLNGSFIKSAIVHALLSIQREGEDLTIDTIARDAASQHLTLNMTFAPKTGAITWQYKGSSGNVAETRKETTKIQIFNELQDKRIPMTVLALITSLGLADTQRTKDTVRQILFRAEKDGLVASSRRGEYYWIETATP